MTVYGWDGDVLASYEQNERKYRLMNTVHAHIFNRDAKLRVKRSLGESLIGYWVRGGLQAEAVKWLKEKRDER